jgi:sterol desaturase/sphingolipid hydroxylase (fatty acid hydroxylase superfamily)
MIRYTRDCLDAVNGHWLTGKPGTGRRAKPESIRVFENPVLEVLSRAHPITPGLWFGPFIVYAGITAPVAIGLGPAAGLFGAGLVGFSLFEYGLHRLVFHGLMRAAVHDERLRLAAFMAHGYHHEFPNDASRLVMPPMISWPLAAIFAVVYAALLGVGRAVPLLAGTMAGYLAYDWIHYYTHHFRPKGGIGKRLRTYHLRHHYQDPNAYFGISSPLWDWVFGTSRSSLPARSTQR